MNEQSTPEYYGYKIGQNIAPYINKCIELTGECYISEGTHIIGRNDKDWKSGNIWGDNIIQWGWTRKHNVKLIGAGYTKTTLKFIDNVQSRYLLDKQRDYILMLQTNYNESCDNNLIQGITFDGNYQNNYSTSTISGIRIRGNNNKIDACRFINFGVGDALKHECFMIALGPVTNNGQGSIVSNCYFTNPGNKTNSPAGFVNETTFIAVGGNQPVVEKNIFENCYYHINNQQSPLHAITLGNVTNGIVRDNVFKNFQGKCIYADSWTNVGSKYYNNYASNVWCFINLTCQQWPDVNQIAFYKNITVENNSVALSDGYTYYQWDKPGYPSSFFSYIYAPNIDTTKHKGFENVNVKDNVVILGYLNENKTYKESSKFVCSWGTPVDSKKINLRSSNRFLSTIPISKKRKTLVERLIEFIKKLL